MILARKFVLLAVIGQAACGASSKPVAPKPSICPKPEAKEGAAEEKKFELGKPPLPSGLVCLRWPMPDFRRVSSGFMDPKHTFTPGKHDGTDMPAPVGTSVLAAAAGEVLWTREVAPCQDAAVAVDIGEGWSLEVHHLSRVDVGKGEKIVPGRRLGLSGGAVDAPGSGPWTTGPHLHFMLVHEGAYVDAAKYLCP
ncbi:MAG TPA: M23 family metallopeptidase [Patescibacteria group bacterium]|nr:M23 family metallopeptidase [Patescibacteria group bacterium]